MLKPGQFPSKPTSPSQGLAYDKAQNAVNLVKFREFWDPELRASIYLNEFIVGNRTWLSTLIDAIDKQGLHQKLQQEKGEQLREVLDASADRDERFAEILDQHNDAMNYWLGMLMIDPPSTPASYLLVRIARRVGEVVVMCLKEHYREARPSQVCPVIVPMMDPPVTPSFPAGHALQSHLISRCLKEAGWPRSQPDLLFDLSRRVSQNRVIAGLHYPRDNEAGVVAADACFAMLKTGDKFKALLSRARTEV